MRILFLHIGPATALYAFLWWHYVRLRHPKIWPPGVWVLFCVGLVFLLAGAVPVTREAIPAATPAARPTSFPMDIFFLIPFWLLNFLPAGVVVLLLVSLFVGGLVIPYLSRRETPTEMGVRHSGVAQVIDGNCTSSTSAVEWCAICVAIRFPAGDKCRWLYIKRHKRCVTDPPRLHRDHKR